MPFDIATLGMQAANSALGGIFGQVLAGANDRRQVKQQQKLQDLQVKGSKELTDYNYQKQLQMWKDTNYSAQVAELQKAGLNPALLYGMSGGGGVTTGSGGGQVSGGQAPSGGGEVGMGIQMALATQMQQAQIELAKSQANKNNVEAANIGEGGIDTRVKEQNIAIGIQQVKESGARTAAQNLDNRMKQMDVIFAESTMNERYERFQYEMKKQFAELEIIQNNAWINRETMEEQKKLIEANAAGRVLENLLTKAQTGLVGKQTQVAGKQVENVGSQTLLNYQLYRKMGQEIMQGWDKLSNEAKQIRISETLMKYNTDANRELKNDIMKFLDAAAGAHQTEITNIYERKR